MGRAPCCSKVDLQRGPWTAREDALLIKYIQAHGEGQWRSLPTKAGLLRCGKSCRLRWMNYLRPDIKRGNITPEEDDLIIRLHGLLGNRWSLIAGRLPGRTDNEIKNYWNTHLSKKLRSQGIDPNTHKKLPEIKLEKPANKRKQKPNEKKERTKIHLPKPVRVIPAISLDMRNPSSSSSQSQSQNQSHELGFDSESNNIIMDMPYPWLSNNNGSMPEEHGLDHLMMMGSCHDDEDVNFDIIQHHDHPDVVAAPIDNNSNSNKQLEKLYEEYLQLIKVDHHDHHDDDGDDDDDDGGDDDAQLDSFTESLLI